MFLNDEADGFATKYYADGARYEGEWTQGYENGYGTFTSADGSDDFTGNWNMGDRAWSSTSEHEDYLDNVWR